MSSDARMTNSEDRIRNSSPDAWVDRFRPQAPARLRLFCFPYAGGTTAIYRGWPREVPPEIDVCAVQLPGRAGKISEPPFTRLQPLVETLAHVLEPYQTLPFAFFGHSMGALISFELARELRRLHRTGPVHLFVSGFRAPHLPDPNPPIHHLPEDEFLAELRALEGTPEEVLQHRELMRLLLPLLRADFALFETYVYREEEPLACPITVFGGLQDTRVSSEDLEAWRLHTRGLLTLRMFRGNHFFLETAQSLFMQVLSRDLSEVLEGPFVVGRQR